MRYPLRGRDYLCGRELGRDYRRARRRVSNHQRHDHAFTSAGIFPAGVARPRNATGQGNIDGRPALERGGLGFALGVAGLGPDTGAPSARPHAGRAREVGQGEQSSGWPLVQYEAYPARSYIAREMPKDDGLEYDNVTLLNSPFYRAAPQ